MTTYKDRYHSDSGFRERVIAKAKQWNNENAEKRRFYYVKRRIAEMTNEELLEYRARHEKILGYAKEELDRRGID